MKKLSQNQKIGIGIGIVAILGIVTYFIFRKRPKVSDLQQEAYDNLTFRLGSADIKESSFESLDKIFSFLKDNNDYNLVVVGHTDSSGSAGFNQTLSENRANAVKNYIASKGINNSRIESSGKGESEPIADNSTAQGREKNRRVTFELKK